MKWYRDKTFAPFIFIYIAMIILGLVLVFLNLPE